MSKLSTKNIKIDGEGSGGKTIEPGINLCKINDVILQEPPYKPGGYHVVLQLETEPIEGFEGFYINKDRPELGRHQGKVGSVKAGEWAFADGTTKSGIEISRDMEMLKFLKQFCKSIDCMDWLNKQEDKHDTIESFFKAFSKDAPYKGQFFRFCVAGKEYTNKGGYTAYDLFLPKYSKDGVPVEADDVQEPKLLKFKPEDHIKRKKVEPVDEFGGDSGGISTGSDFDL